MSVTCTAGWREAAVKRAPGRSEVAGVAWRALEIKSKIALIESKGGNPGLCII
ncbi:hypothetical protein [Burkholderia glumae]|uniref:hypothetical protein n=1 Tax=Burkholderia glumae TaxID=337 RepID=UPI0003A9F9F2|nr:hypothetical protein [Burkholderia glumae]